MSRSWTAARSWSAARSWTAAVPVRMTFSDNSSCGERLSFFSPPSLNGIHSHRRYQKLSHSGQLWHLVVPNQTRPIVVEFRYSLLTNSTQRERERERLRERENLYASTGLSCGHVSYKSLWGNVESTSMRPSVPASCPRRRAVPRAAASTTKRA